MSLLPLLLLLAASPRAAVSPEPAPEIAAARPAGLALLKALQPSPEDGIRLVNVVSVDPSAFELRAVRAQTLLGKPRATLPEVLTAVPEAVAGMNASFFSLKDGRLVGFFMEGGRVVEHHPHPSMDRVFFSRADGKVGVAFGTKIDPAGVVSAVSGKSEWEEASDSARVALCIDQGARVRLVSAYPVRDLARMSRYLTRKEGCRRIAHLDGGGSAQLYFRGELTIGWERGRGCEKAVRDSPPECFRPVAAFLLVVPRR